MSSSPERERTSGRMIAANSLGWIPTTRGFWVDGGVNSILTLVPSLRRRIETTL